LPWKNESLMVLRHEFIAFATQPQANISSLCRRFKISRKTGYKWLARSRADPDSALADVPRRPIRSPGKTAMAMEQLVTGIRSEHPAWGARKIKRRLEDLDHLDVPARSTVNDILRRNGCIDPTQSRKHSAFVRFERPAPNELWQMDFKGHFATTAGRCHPLTMLDDHSRFNLLLRACDNERLETVQAALIDTMRLYGMPACILSDNGPPWGSFGVEGNWTTLGAWMLRLGVRVAHGRPGHPQTQGKEERFHRTLKAEAIGSRSFHDIEGCQQVFDSWRQVYNSIRPHEALGLAVPVTRYTPSARAYPETLAPIEYGSGDQVRKVCEHGEISFRSRPRKVGRAFVGEKVAVRATTTEGKMEVFYCHQRVAEIDLRVQNGGR
jgi:transposase InsO family protein